MAMSQQHIQLVIAAQNGDVDSFQSLYTAYYSKVYGFARMILKNDHDAEDVLQETFLSAWQKLDTLQSPAAFSVWIQIIAKNLCNMQLRRKNIAILLDADKEIENFDIEEPEDMLPAVYVERADLKERLGRVIDSLSDVQRLSITLYYFNELSIDEISQVMECSPGTVKSRLFLARKAIKAELEEQERQTGQKFYGVAGIALISMSEAIRLHLESLLLDKSVALAAFNASKGSLVKTVSMDKAQAVGTYQPGKGGVIMKALPLKIKIITAITALAALGAVATLVIILVGGNKPDLQANDHQLEATSPAEFVQTPEQGNTVLTPDSPGNPNSGQNPIPTDITIPAGTEMSAASLDAFWLRNQGYWKSTPYTNNFDDVAAVEGLFVGYFRDGADYRLEYGLYQSSYWIGGEVVQAIDMGDSRYAFIMHIAATPETAIDGARPERWEIVYVHEISNITNIRIENLSTGAWAAYEYGGQTLEQAFSH